MQWLKRIGLACLWIFVGVALSSYWWHDKAMTKGWIAGYYLGYSCGASDVDAAYKSGGEVHRIKRK